MKTEAQFRKKVNSEADALIRYFRGKDIRMAIPAMLAVIEYYVQAQFPHVRKYAVKELGFLIKRLKKDKNKSKNKNNSEGKYNLKISS